MKFLIYLPLPPMTKATRPSGIKSMKSRYELDEGKDVLTLFLERSDWISKSFLKTA